MKNYIGAVIWLSGLLLSTAIAAETRTVPPPPRQALYGSAKAFERDGKYDDAKSIYRMAIHNGAAGRDKYEAYLGLARCEEKQRNFWQAFLAVESSYPSRDEIIEMTADTRREELIRRAEVEFRLADELAKLENAEAGITPDGKKMSGYQAAAAAYYAIVYNNPQTPLALQSLIKRGDCLRRTGDFAEAEKAYRMLINTFPDAPEIAEAKISLAALLAAKTASNGGLRGREEAETTDILRSASTVKNLQPEVREKLDAAKLAINENKAQSLLATVKDYYLRRTNHRDRGAAVFLLKDIIARYPHTQAAGEAAELLVELKK